MDNNGTKYGGVFARASVNTAISHDPHAASPEADDGNQNQAGNADTTLPDYHDRKTQKEGNQDFTKTYFPNAARRTGWDTPLVGIP